MARKSIMAKVGVWAFIIGILGAIIISLIAAFGGEMPGWAPIVLAVLGLLVGILNVSPSETKAFLIAAIAFMISFTSLSEIAGLFGSSAAKALGTFFSLMGVFIAPAAAVVALLAILYISRD